MPKSAVINIEREGLLEKISFKKLALFFDNVYIDHRELVLSKFDIEQSKIFDEGQRRALLTELDWMIEKGIIVPFSVERSVLQTRQFEEKLVSDVKEVHKAIEERLIPVEREEETEDAGEFRFAGVVQLDNNLIFKMEDIRTRMSAAALCSINPAVDFVPVISSFSSYQQPTTQEMAASFVLDKLPVPDPNTAWEQVIDFKEDKDVQRKYFALLHWVNQARSKDTPYAHFIDQYNTLYAEYMRQYSLHKINSSFTTIELLVSAGVDFVSLLAQHNYLGAAKSLISVRKQQVSLLRQEKEIEGRELAYIFSANEAFSKRM